MSSLLFGIALRLKDGHSFGDEDPFLCCVEDAGDIVAVALQTPPHNLLIHVEPGTPAEAIAHLARHVAEVRLRPPGVHAERNAAFAFAGMWEAETGTRSEVSMAQRLYRITQVRFPTGVTGRLRVATERDRELLLQWVKAFVEEAVGDGPHPDPEGLVDRLTRAGALFVWTHRRPVSMASSSRPTPNGIAVNLVYTPPERRRRGYASACVAAVSQRQLEAGRKFCTLFADLENLTSNALYQRIGYHSIGEFIEIRFRGETYA